MDIATETFAGMVASAGSSGLMMFYMAKEEEEDQQIKQWIKRGYIQQNVPGGYVCMTCGAHVSEDQVTKPGHHRYERGYGCYWDCGILVPVMYNPLAKGCNCDNDEYNERDASRFEQVKQFYDNRQAAGLTGYKVTSTKTDK